MTISEFEIFNVEKSAKKFCSERNKNYPPDQLLIEYKLENQTLYLIEVRPKWNDPSIRTEKYAAKLSYIKKDKQWKLYWQRANLSWLLYEEKCTSNQLETLLQVVWDDPHGCFWG